MSMVLLPTPGRHPTTHLLWLVDLILFVSLFSKYYASIKQLIMYIYNFSLISSNLIARAA